MNPPQNQYVTGTELIIDGGWLLVQREFGIFCLLSSFLTSLL